MVRIDANTLRQLEQLEYKRATIGGHVSKLYKLLVDGKHFEAVFVVNYTNSKYRLIDGNHRYEAIKKFIQEDPTRYIDVNFVIYNGATEEEEREIFEKWNSGRKQTANDFVQMNQKAIPILQKMLSNFPAKVSIYPLKEGQKGIHFNSVISAYLSATKAKFPNFSLYGGGVKKLVEDSQKLNDADYASLCEFVKFFTDTFGTLEKGNNMYMTSAMVSTISIIYYDNKAALGRAALVKRFQSKVIGNSNLITLGQGTSKTTIYYLYSLMVDELNTGFSRNFIMRRYKEKDMPARISAQLPQIIARGSSVS